MNLKDWLDKEGISGTEFARRLNVAKATIYRYSTGSRLPRPSILRKISDATDGNVTASEFKFTGDQNDT